MGYGVVVVAAKQCDKIFRYHSHTEGFKEVAASSLMKGLKSLIRVGKYQ